MMEFRIFSLFRLFFVITGILILLCSSPARRAVASEHNESDPVSLDTIVVTAEKGSADYQTGDVELDAVPAFYTVIQRDQFEGKMESLAEVIEKEAGIQVRRSGGLGSFSSMALRGSTSEQVMIYLDGVLLNDASGGGVNLSNISLADVASIEIYRGSTPIHFGHTSIGGVVNIQTIRNQGGLNMNASVGYGSFKTRSAAAFINHKPGQWDYLVSADYLDSDNNFEFMDDNQTRYNTADDRKVTRNNAQFDQTSVLAKVGYDISPDKRIDVSHQCFHKNQGLPRLNNSPLARTTLDTRYNISSLKLTVDDLSPFSINTSTLIDYSKKTEEYDDSAGEIGLGRQWMRYVTERYGGRVFLEKHTRRNTITVTVDGHQERYAPENLLNTSALGESSRDTIGLGIQNRCLLFNDRLAVIPAVRYVQLSDKLDNAEDFFGRPDETLISRKDNYLTPQIGIKFSPANWLTLKTNLARYQRDPSFFELFGDRGFFMGNMDLVAEKGTNFDAGVECRWSREQALIERVVISAAYFQSDVDDLITRVYDARGIGRSVNISGSFISGIEAGIDMDLLKYLTLSANATFQDTENQSEVRVFDGKKLPGRFEKSYLGRLTAKFSKMKVYAEYMVEKDMYYDTANLLKAADKYELNAGAAWNVRSVQINLEVRNIGDNQYEDFNGYPLPGRACYMTIKYSL